MSRGYVFSHGVSRGVLAQRRHVPKTPIPGPSRGILCLRRNRRRPPREVRGRDVPKIRIERHAPRHLRGGGVLKLESGGQHFRRGGSRTARQRRGMPCHRGFPQGGGIPRRRFFCPGEKPGRISPGPFASLRSPAERRESQAINRGRSPLWEGRTLLPLSDVGEAA